MYHLFLRRGGDFSHYTTEKGIKQEAVGGVQVGMLRKIVDRLIGQLIDWLTDCQLTNPPID